MSGGEGIGARESAAWHQTSTTEAKVAYFKERCEAYGYTSDSKELSDCIRSEMRASSNAARNKMQRSTSYTYKPSVETQIELPKPVVCNRRMIMTPSGCRYP